MRKDQINGWVLVLTGLRIGEILALRWKYVDLCRHTLRVAETVYDGHFDTPKSQRSARIVPLAEEACSTLGKLRSSSTRPDDLVFSMDTGQPLDRHNLLRRQLRPTCEKLGLLGITWHSLRHAHATLLDAAGAPWEQSSLFLVTQHRNSLEKCTCTLYRRISVGR